jgi:armadillo repeat-containing protein 8
MVGELLSSKQNRVLTALRLLLGGPSFVQPMLHSSIIPNLLTSLSSTNCHPKVVVSTLKCLNSLADRLPASAPTQWLQDKQLANLLYSPQYIGSLERILAQSPSSGLSQRACSLAIALICKTCTDERQKRALADAEVLTALSTRFASILVAEGFVLPSVDSIGQDSSTFRPLPPPAPASARLAPLLQAIALFIEQSKTRASQFLSSPIIAAVLPKLQNETSQSDMRRIPWGSHFSAATVSRTQNQGAIDSLLPTIPQNPATLSPEHFNFPPLGSVIAAPKRRPSLLPTTSESRGGQLSLMEKPEEEESPVISLLVYLVYARSGMCRLMAAKVLIFLFNLGFVQKSRLQSFCMLLVPVLVRMLDDDQEGEQDDWDEHDLACLSMTDQLKTQTPAILAALIMDEPDLQKAAVDAGAIKKMCKALKTTFEPLHDSSLDMWTSEKFPPTRYLETETRPDRREGEKGPDPLFRRVMSYREGLLKALAAVAPFNDEYRRAICDQGILPCVIDCLRPLSTFSPSSLSSKQSIAKIGNPAGTLLAACGVVRALTRSVSALRTNLIDAGIAPPILQLLTSGDPEIKIAATKVVSNLSMDVSPMKERVSQPGVIKTLCEQAHSANPRLRFESIWALKQLVHNSSNPLKISVIQELGPSWMKHLIQTDPADVPPGVVIGMADMDFPPRTNSYPCLDSDANDVIMGEASDDGPAPKYEKGFRDDPYKHTIEDDTAIQEQLLDFIRNLFCGDKASEIIEYIFGEMGEADFFEIMHARLRTKVVPGATRKENRTILPPTGIVTKVLYILIHIAASLSKFRTQIASNTALLRQVLYYINHPCPEIRAQCCWIAINLTYEDDPSDRAACKHRASDLQKAGYLPKLATMGEDVNLDVRERTKTAMHLIRQLLS